MGRLVSLAVFAFVGCSDPSGAGGGGGSAGMGGEDTGDGGNGGDGTVIECRTEDDCTPGRGNCNVRLSACVDGACVVKPLPDGSICQASGAGECMDRVGTCVDGACVATPLPDGTPCTADFEQCTEDVCLAGVCEHPAFEDETPCDEDNECTAMGACTSAECIATPVENGTHCAAGAGTCQTGRCSATFACTEAGIREAIVVGGGPHTFDCDGPTTVMVEQGFTMDRDVELDAEGELTLEGVGLPIVFTVGSATVTLRGFTVLRGGGGESSSSFAAINNHGGRLTLAGSTISESCCWFAVHNYGDLVVLRSSIVDNPHALGIFNQGSASIISSTVANNVVFDVHSSGGPLSISNSTIGELTAYDDTEIVNSTIGTVEAASGTIVNSTIEDIIGGQQTVRGSLVWSCFEAQVVSLGYNINIGNDFCGFDQLTDQAEVDADEVKLLRPADNGGPTETRALAEGSVAIDVISAEDCVDADGEPLTTDQRGEPRDSMCDVGAFEVQP